MCSSLAHTLFTLVMTLTFVLLVISLVTPGWQHVTGHTGTADPTVVERGLVTQKCDLNYITQDVIENAEECVKALFEESGTIQLQSYEKTALGLMVISIVLCFFSLIWSCVIRCACCCEGCLTVPLLLATLVGAVVTLAAIGIYWSKSDDILDNLSSLTTVTRDHLSSTVGYSAYIAILSVLGYVAGFALAIWMMCVSKTAVL